MATKAVYTHLDLKGNRLYNVGTLTPTATSNTLDFADTVDNLQSYNVTLATTFTTANLAAGRTKTVLITGTLALGVTFPSAWIWYGSKLTTIPAGKEVRLRLTAYGTTDATVRAEYVTQA